MKKKNHCNNKENQISGCFNKLDIVFITLKCTGLQLFEIHVYSLILNAEGSMLRVLKNRENFYNTLAILCQGILQRDGYGIDFYLCCISNLKITLLIQRISFLTMFIKHTQAKAIYIYACLYIRKLFM